MTKYVANVKEIFRARIHAVGTVKDGEVLPIADLPLPLPLPNRIEIELDGGRQEPCMMFRYTHCGEFCSDTWHENLDGVLAQALFEYGLTEDDFQRVDS